MSKLLAGFAGLLIVLSAIGWATPPPIDTSDRNIYEQMAADVIVPNCDLLHCFRVLVPWTLGRLPGPSLFKWKMYSVVCNAAAAIAVFLLCQAWGLTRRVAQIAAAATALGFGSMYTLFDPFTSDPLMFLAGPLLLWLPATGRLVAAGTTASLLIVAKEFAVVPVYMHAVMQWLEGRRAAAVRAAMIAAAVVGVWIALQLWLRMAHGYFFGATLSAQPLRGGYLWHWYTQTPGRIAIAVLLSEFGVLWLLAPVGWRYAPPRLRHAVLASLPPVAAFLYVQQPDRALWNFHFLVTPLAALVLARVPVALAATTLLVFAVGNLRVGAQLPFAPPASASLGVSLLLGGACCAWLWRQPERVPA